MDNNIFCAEFMQTIQDFSLDNVSFKVPKGQDCRFYWREWQEKALLSI